jgi:hypothetical protein
MAKVMIYEDEFRALFNRYSDLVDNHDVSVCMVGRDVRLLGAYSKSLQESGFDNSKVKGIIDIKSEPKPNWVQNPPKADIYFMDGLNGDCFHILKFLPKDKTYLFTGDSDVIERAKKEGYKFASIWNLEKVIRENSRNG